MNQDELLKILIVEDHELFRNGAVSELQKRYETAEIQSAQTADGVVEKVGEWNPNLVILDLSIPKVSGETATTENGIALLKQLMKSNPDLNLTVQSTYIKRLMTLKPDIDVHQGGFTIADKSLQTDEMLRRVDLALQGATFTRDLQTQSGMEFRPEWLELLRLAFQEGLQDQAIAQKMNVSLRTVRNYWNKVQDALGVYPEEGRNTRIQTEIRAREVGLID